MQILQTHSHLDRISQNPEKVISQLKIIRELIIQAAKEEQIALIEETLKWNEPSFVTKGGSTIRYDWKEKTPDQVQIYFKYTSKIVPSIKAKF